ncbi:hypothetical protein MVEN_01454500 [Mycena venus]|uniref:Ubiquitin 3 binding protein But2 C-terminal domain-containing protein n=1 Tax=Mycena venus TaxID=2733690 RepID=A0A8H6XV66_9AGAR|nr:hypothetical protein MVEN_01454500 [Mycena venus]
MVDSIPLLSPKPASSSISSDMDEWGPSPPSTRTQFSRDSENRALWLIVLGCLISIGTVLLNIAHFRQQYTVTPHNKLEYPNPYIGLENAILKDVALHAPILNFPLLLSQINMSDPAVAYEDLHHWSSNFGMIYPEDRTFLVSSEVSTIIQIRTIDFAMERCVLTLAVPSIEDQKDSGKELISSAGPLSLDIWALDSMYDIDPHTLSWFTRPVRSHLLTTIVFSDPGQFESPSFSCPSRTLHTFEDAKLPHLAIFLMQHPSD